MNEERNDNLTAANAKGAESFKVRGMRIGTMNLPFHGPRLCRRPTAATIHEELQRSRIVHWNHEPETLLGLLPLPKLGERAGVRGKGSLAHRSRSRPPHLPTHGSWRAPTFVEPAL